MEGFKLVRKFVQAAWHEICSVPGRVDPEIPGDALDLPVIYQYVSVPAKLSLSLFLCKAARAVGRGC
jgi:hypothetical protein